MSKPSLKVRFPLYLLIGLGLPLLITVYLTTGWVRTSVESQTRNHLETVSQLMQTIIQDTFLNYRHHFEDYAKRLELRSQPMDSDAILSDIFMHQTYFQALYLVSPDGHLLHGIHRSADLSGYRGFDLSMMEFWKKVSHEKRLIQTDITQSFFSDHPTLVYAIPLKEMILVGHLDLNQIAAIYKRLRPSQASGFGTYITDRKGTVIFDSKGDISVQQRINLSRHPLIKALQHQTKKVSYLMFTFEKRAYVGDALNLSPSGWNLLLFTPVDIAYETLDMLEISAFILSIGGVLIVLFFYIWTARSILKPIAIFESKAARIAQGDYNLQVPNFQYREPSVLAAHFKEMAEKVHEREVRLANLNASLEERIKEAADEIRQTELILHEQAKRKSINDLLIDLAHHWRQPLNACTLEIQNIEDLLEGGEHDDEIIEIIEIAVNELISLSDTITHLTSFYESKSTRNVTFAEGLSMAEEFSAHSLKINSINVISNIDEHFSIQAEAGIWVELLSALMLNVKETLNSRKAHSATVWINAEESKDESIITFRDDAGGIDPAMLPTKLFEAYSTTQFKTRNKGLGLYVVHSLITHRLEGKITAQNSDNGAEFIIRIPHGRE